MSESSTEQDQPDKNDLKHRNKGNEVHADGENPSSSPVLVVDARTESSSPDHPEDEDARVEDIRGEAEKEESSFLKDGGAETTPEDPPSVGGGAEQDHATKTTPGEVIPPTTGGAKRSGVLGKFEEPVLTRDTKFHNPVTSHIGAKHANVQDKFTEPVLRKERPAAVAAHVGARHAATGLDFVAQPTKFGGGGVSPKTASLDRSSWGKEGPTSTPAGKKFKWAVVGGVWKKQYDNDDDNDGAPSSETTAPAASSKTNNNDHHDENVTSPRDDTEETKQEEEQ